MATIPLTIILGISTIISLLITATLGFLTHRGKPNLFKYHKTLAYLTILLALIHAGLVINKYYF